MIKQLYRFLSPKFQNLNLEYKVDFKPRYGHGMPAHRGLYNCVNEHRTEYAALLTEALQHKHVFANIKKANEQTDLTQPVYNSGFLPGLDIVGIYTLISKYKPSKYVEVGSGTSTKVAYKAIKDQALRTEIISIDPCPRAEIDQLATKVIREPFENTNFDFLFELQENDIVFIDNSHRILPNSDSMVFFLEVLPRLPKGVIVHLHDIYIPYDYPQFMCNRFYSEQYGLAMYLLANPGRYKTILPNYFISEDQELRSILSPLWSEPALQGVEQHGGSYWLQIS